jgi:uncharacterized protein involved in exopolysaccharide biosynthesis
MNIQLFIRFLFRKKRVFIINFILIAFCAWGYAFLIAKKEYLAQVTFLPPVSNEMGSQASLFGFNIPTLSSPGILPEQIYTVFASKASNRRIIDHFDLVHKFKLTKSKNKYVLASKLLKKTIVMDVDQTSNLGFQQNTISFTISCYSTSPDTAKLMAEYVFALVDSAIRCISMNRASRNRIFIEGQLAKSKESLDSLEHVFETFQKENKAYVIPEQLKLSLNSYATIKANALMTEIQIKALQRERNESSPQIQELQRNLAVINQKLKSMETSETPDVLPSFNLSAKLIPIFTNLKRDIEAREQIILLLTKELEQAKIQEAKNVSSLVIVDAAFRPEYKDRPKRLPLMAAIILLENCFLLLILSYQFTFGFLLANNRGFAALVEEFWPHKRSP